MRIGRTTRHLIWTRVNRSDVDVGVHRRNALTVLHHSLHSTSAVGVLGWGAGVLLFELTVWREVFWHQAGIGSGWTA